MTYNTQLKKGIKVEREHKSTYKFLMQQKKMGKCPTENKFYESIAKDHLKEDKNYYTKLNKAKL